jgi:hypothetical protein
VFSFSPSLVTKTDEDDGVEASAHSRWSLFLGTMKMMATLVLVSVFFSLLLLVLSLEMIMTMAIKACCVG